MFVSRKSNFLFFHESASQNKKLAMQAPINFTNPLKSTPFSQHPVQHLA